MGALYFDPSYGPRHVNSHKRWVNLRDANLFGAVVDQEALYGAYLDGAISPNGIPAGQVGGIGSPALIPVDDRSLANANLANAVLRHHDFANADLSGADLTGADLTGAQLSGADLTGADLTGATCPNGIVFGQLGSSLPIRIEP